MCARAISMGRHERNVRHARNDGVRCDNRVLLRESGAQSNIFSVKCSYMFVVAYAGKIQPLSTRNLWFRLRYYMSLAIEKSSISSHIITVYTNVLRNGSFSSTPARLKEVVRLLKRRLTLFRRLSSIV